MRFKLGGDPERHGATDCVGLARCVLAFYGIATPTPTRDWYRRLRRGDTSIFREQLENWGARIIEPRIGAVALCQAESGYGLAVWWQAGWLNFRGNQVVWCPPEALAIEDLYCPQKLISATP
jgi:hypothetical protein